MAQSQASQPSPSNGTAKPSAKVAHVNLMVDTIIANIDVDGLRSIMRSMLASEPSLTSEFQQQVLKYLEKTKPRSIASLFTLSNSPNATPKPTSAFESHRRRARCLMGCGKGFKSLEILTEIVCQTMDLPWVTSENSEGEELEELLASIDGDIIQGLTAVEKELHVSEGARKRTEAEEHTQIELRNALAACQAKAEELDGEFVFERGLMCLDAQLRSFQK